MGNAHRSLLVICAFALSVGLVTPASAQSGSVTPESLKAAAAYSERTGGVSMLVYQDGKLIFEQYANGGAADKPYLLASGTKAFSCALALAARQDGLLTLDEKAADTLTEWRADPLLSKTTIRDLLTFVSGLESGAQAEFRAGNTTDVYQLAASLKGEYEPGTVFVYGNLHLAAFGELLTRKLAAAGGDFPADPLAYLQREVLEPIGAQVGSWRRDIAGNPMLAGGASFTAREWAKWGLLVLNGGVWEGKQILPADGLKECIAGSKAFLGYGFGFWTNTPIPPGMITPQFVIPAGIDRVPGKGGIFPDYTAGEIWMAAGARNQRMVIVPDLKLVIVRQARSEGVGALRAGRDWEDAEFLRLALGL